jgi:hypothetical protein
LHSILALAASAALSSIALAGDVSFTVNGQPAKPGEMPPADIKELVIDNGSVKVVFGKDDVGDFSATSIVKDGVELAHNLNGLESRDYDRHRTLYLDYNASRGHLVADTIKIVKNTPEIAHFAVMDTKHPAAYLEHHFVMIKDESGIHDYVIIDNRAEGGGRGGGEMRTGYRFDRNILTWAWTVEHVGQQQTYDFLEGLGPRNRLGDETYRLPDGSVYQKYDYAAYFAESPMWGHFGRASGKWVGAFFMPVSTESYAGGPLRQELIVHQDALILNYIGGGHFGGGGTAYGRNGPKMHGPWFLYLGSGETADQLIADAKKVAGDQQAQWPYKWVEEPLYPLNRTVVSGQLKISHNRSAAGAQIILAQPNNGAGGRGGRGGAAPEAGAAPEGAAPDAAAQIAPEAAGGAGAPAGRGAAGGRGFGRGRGAGPATAPGAEANAANPAARGGRGGRGGGTPTMPDRANVVYSQGGDYIYYVKADENGKFSIPHVRAGTYTLYAWQTQGPITQSFAKDGVEVKGDKLDLGDVQWDAPYRANVLWQMGKPDRMAGEFKLGDRTRSNQWPNYLPQELTYTVGKSKDNEDWYYSQRGGDWNIKFNVDKNYPGNAYLRIAIAGGGGRLTATLNGKEVGAIQKGNDSSISRATVRSGVYAAYEFSFPASTLKQGENTLTINSSGLMFDTMVMEAD